MSAILKFDFQNRKQLRFSEVNYLNYTKKTQFCNFISPKTGENNNKPWNHSTPLKMFYLQLNYRLISFIKSIEILYLTLYSYGTIRDMSIAIVTASIDWNYIDSKC